MRSNQDLTHNRQKANLHLRCYHNQTSSSTLEPSSRSQLLGDPDLFATLLFDRQRAYQRPSSTSFAPSSSSRSKVRDTTPVTQSLASKNEPKGTAMPPRTTFMIKKQKQQVKGERVTKTLSAKPATKLGKSRAARNSESARETATPEDTDVVMISSDEEEEEEEEEEEGGEGEALEIQQLRSELKAAKARIKQLEDLLETKEAIPHNSTIEQVIPKKNQTEYHAQEFKSEDSTKTEESDTSLTKESLASKEKVPLELTKSHAKSMARTVEVPLPLTPQSPPSSIPTQIPPYPGSIILTEEDLKLENIRATYTKVKRKMDTLQILARKLDWCTNSMDFSNFGEFGVHMKRLREWLKEEDGQQ